MTDQNTDPPNPESLPPLPTRRRDVSYFDEHNTTGGVALHEPAINTVDTTLDGNPAEQTRDTAATDSFVYHAGRRALRAVGDRLRRDTIPAPAGPFIGQAAVRSIGVASGFGDRPMGRTDPTRPQSRSAEPARHRARGGRHRAKR